jgi:hypothetical protein
MKCILISLVSALILFATSESYGQFARFDSTLKMGRVGYRVMCNNKSADKNELSVRPIGFESTAREMKFYIKGQVAKAEIDDLNNNGFPDLLVYIYSGLHGEYGNVFAFISVENKSFTPTAMPDATMNGKISDGYKGHDIFSLMEGTLMQKFPIYKAGDSTDRPTGGNRMVQYNLVGSDNGGYQFKMIRFYDLK